MGNENHEHVWVEQGRYIPYLPRDFDPDAQLVEDPRDADGQPAPLEREGYEAPKPYVWWDCQVPSCTEVKREEIPDAAYQRLVRLLEVKALKPEHLSQLPLGELIPEMAQHQALLSGAARIALPELPPAAPPPVEDTGGA